MNKIYDVVFHDWIYLDDYNVVNYYGDGLHYPQQIHFISRTHMDSRHEDLLQLAII